ASASRLEVEELRAPPHRVARAPDGAGVRAAFDQPADRSRSSDVRPLADDDEVRVGEDRERLEAAERGLGLSLRDDPWGLTPDGGANGLDVFGRGPAAAADEVDETVLRELAEVRARVGRLLVVRPELVREPGVRMAGDVRRRDPREVLDKRAHLGGAERAVDADDERLGVLDREPEGLDGLAREVPTAAVDRRERDPERQVGRLVERGRDR